MKHFYLLGIALLCLTSLPAQVRKIAAIGSSTTEGQGAWPPDSSWLRRVNYYYKYQFNVIDSAYRLAVGGYSMYKGMPSGYAPPPGRPAPDPLNNISRANALLSDLPVPSNGVIIVNYPSNGYIEYSIEEIMTSLQVIYDSAVAAGHQCYITTTQPRDDGAFATSEFKRKLAIIKDSTINRFGVEHTLNFWDGMYNPADTTRKTEYAAGDLIHLNNAGHRELFNRVVAKDIFGINATLPVIIENFSALLKNAAIELKWTAHHDDSNSWFIVQRSADGAQFQSLTRINADNNGNGKKLYRFEDNPGLTGTIYYRLEIHEAAHTYYSPVISVKIPATEFVAGRIYPTRVGETLTLEIFSPQAQRITMEIISSNGVRVKTFVRQLQRDKNIITLPVPALSSGSYFLRIISPGKPPVIQTFLK